MALASISAMRPWEAISPWVGVEAAAPATRTTTPTDSARGHQPHKRGQGQGTMLGSMLGGMLGGMARRRGRAAPVLPRRGSGAARGRETEGALIAPHAPWVHGAIGGRGDVPGADSRCLEISCLPPYVSMPPSG